MKKDRLKSPLLAMVFLAGVIYGIAIYKYHLFPYKILKFASSRIHKDSNTHGTWSIGIYTGSTPFNLTDPEDISNPVLTAKDVTDMEAYFVADPFMIIKNDKYFMFFEALNKKTNHGDIAYAESIDGKKWDYKKVVIDEKFHLSYPHIFEWGDQYYLIPESHEDFSVRLYQATKFPEKWEYVGNLLSGYSYADPTVFRHNNTWWLFVYTGGRSALNLYFSKDLLTGWKPHPMNPVARLDKNFTRPGGRVVNYRNKLYRLTQDDYPSYGIQVYAFEITRLSETIYADKLVSKKPIITKTGIGWNAAGMHHVDLHKIKDKWISAVDGKDKTF